MPQVKQLRLEREREKAMREQELEMLQREKEAEHFKTWEEQEDNFHLQQAKLRCGPAPTSPQLARPRAFALTARPAWSPPPCLSLPPFRSPPAASWGAPFPPPFWPPLRTPSALSLLPSLCLSLRCPSSPVELGAEGASECHPPRL